ncbi:pyrimidine 5-nucleotidase [Mycena belliarum]|uniref:Pyrimidine 5-nucleotidase n=1 Tax=Mycena belliarum TaxID=1033014 RepID=A0AAD6UB22_9AGAR|nr:pyrimidine 5-nucleotidase [Mycena belliae]
MASCIFLDIDNTLYSASSGISAEMGKKIHEYFTSLGLGEDEASALHHKYYTEYGLALRGLILHHDVDPVDFDQKCDGALPLEDLISPTPSLRKLLQDIDRSKASVWGLTNAYRPHAERVLRILNLDDLIDGLIFCDYQKPNFACKPDPQFYHDALEKARVSDPSKCYFVDDNRINVDAARALGWGHVAHFCETGLVHVEGGKVKKIGSDRKNDAENGVKVITDLEELRTIWAEVFK